MIQGQVKAGDRVVAEGIQKVRQDAVVNPVPFGEKTIAASGAIRRSRNRSLMPPTFRTS